MNCESIKKKKSCSTQQRAHACVRARVACQCYGQCKFRSWHHCTGYLRGTLQYNYVPIISTYYNTRVSTSGRSTRRVWAWVWVCAPHAHNWLGSGRWRLLEFSTKKYVLFTTYFMSSFQIRWYYQRTLWPRFDFEKQLDIWVRVL